MSTPAVVTVEGRDGLARAGTVRTARGEFATPCFMPVGTRGAVRLLVAEDLEDLGVQVVLANAYHLMLRPGAETVARLGGLHAFMGWSGQVLTDSGGYQVFSLRPAVDDDGVAFRSTYDGTGHHLTPEGAVAVQELLGADIQMALDVCLGLPAPAETVRLAADRTLAWAKRARDAHRRHDQSIFGIVQGGTSPGLREEAATAISALDFDGYAVGGLAVGEPLPERLPALAAALGPLPDDRPRYLMGVGDPLSLVDAVALGVDLFDCVLPTRLARHGTALTGAGRLPLRGAASAADERPVDPSCGCPVCARYSRGYVRHLLVTGEPAGGRLLSVHNLAWLMGLMARIRQAVLAGRLSSLRAEVAARWARPGPPSDP